MAMYNDKCKKACLRLNEAFPNGFTVAQVNAINEAIRATMSVRNHATMDKAIRDLFPNAKFTFKKVEREYDGKVFDIMECSEANFVLPENR